MKIFTESYNVGGALENKLFSERDLFATPSLKIKKLNILYEKSFL